MSSLVTLCVQEKIATFVTAKDIDLINLN